MALSPAVAFSSGETATHLYQIAQEAITNAVRHGSATEIEIAIQCEDGFCELRISDNGAGFDPRDRESLGSGMRSMGYRASVIGGRMSIVSGAHRGTIVSCIVPDP
ncbi:sensor histidine kinase [Novipirellula artificiosorum]|uniref:Sensor protein VraS n=1 Tax=Novipirellula artificiosorum TaxID=2528016 RepID=A0A5C6DLV2_9BACT|nr:Sensor protein VraS [Novipirellula artificiosorum]